MLKKILILFMILSVAFMFNICCSKKEENGEKTEETGEEETEIVEEETPEELKGFIEINQEKEVGDYVITLKGFEITKEIQGLTPEAGNEFVKVELEVGNKKNAPWLISSALAFRIVGDDFTDEIKTSKYTGEGAFTDGMVEPGKKASGIVVFEIPENQRT
jgi:hypothetical protein